MQVINKQSNNYPILLKNISNPPQILYVEGDINLLNKNLVAIIGSRNYTEYGAIQAKRFAEKLSKSGLGIVSGMAIGIDTFAHMQTIKCGGKTVAVLGSGFNNIYPKENKQLYDLILKTGGAIISEYPPDSKMQKRNFPLRNRIVSGLSLGTLVIEATHRSGTSITANYAWQQGRKVYCIPNAINNKNSCGTINLLKKGAQLTTKPQEIIESLGELTNKIQLNHKQEFINEITKLEKPKYLTNIIQKQEVKYQKHSDKLFLDLSQYDENTKNIIKTIQKNHEVDSNTIANTLKLPIQKINAILTTLEIDEIIQNTKGNQYQLFGDVDFFSGNKKGESNV